MDYELGVFYDLETSGLDAAGYDLIFTCGFAPLDGSDPYVFGNDNVPVDNDVELSISIRDELQKYPFIVGYNSHGFDLKFLNTRLRKNGERQLLHAGSMDLATELKRIFPYFGTGNIAKLDDFCKALDIEHDETGAYNKQIWDAASRGDATAMAHISQHNRDDVVASRKLFEMFFHAEES